MPLGLFALFGIGRHAPQPTAAPSLATHALAAAGSVPVGIWIALIGLLGAIGGPVVAHVLETRRAKG